MRRLLGKVRAQIGLMRRDPQAFAGNLMQWTHPALFQARLEDLPVPPPLALRPDPGRQGPRLSLLLQTVAAQGMTGGPNTALNLVLRIARAGVPVRLLQTVKDGGLDSAWLHRHLAALAGDPVPELTLETAADPARPAAVGPEEVFMATHWTTAQQLQPQLPGLRIRQFLYLIQDYEPGFHAWSSSHAMALETYGMDCWPVCNSGMLATHLVAAHPGPLAERLITFEPAVDAALFHPPAGAAAARPRRLLFYARPTNPRNLFGMGLAALRRVAAEPALAGWEFLAIGGRGGVPAIPLGAGRMLRPAPWHDYRGYAELLQQADVLLAPMLSPHTGYPVLEMAASGGLAVTNSFGVKTAAALTALSGNILVTAPSVEGFAAQLLAAAGQVEAGRPREARLELPRSWATALDPAAAQLAALIRRLAAA
jgi:hypothetical protein